MHLGLRGQVDGATQIWWNFPFTGELEEVEEQAELLSLFFRAAAVSPPYTDADYTGMGKNVRLGHRIGRRCGCHPRRKARILGQPNESSRGEKANGLLMDIGEGVTRGLKGRATQSMDGNTSHVLEEHAYHDVVVVGAARLETVHAFEEVLNPV